MRRRWVAIGFVLLMGCGRGPDSRAKARPIRVHVVDSQTGAPLEGIRVLYAVQTMVSADVPWWAPPLGGPTGPRLAYGAEAMTNGNGDATFAGTLKYTSREEELDQLIIFTNVRVNTRRGLAETRASGMSEHCKDRPVMCDEAGPELQVAAFTLTSQADERDSVFELDRPEHVGEVLVLNVDPQGAERIPREAWGRTLHMRYVSSRAANEAGPVVVKLTRRRPTPAVTTERKRNPR